MWENLIYDKDIKEKVCSTVVVQEVLVHDSSGTSVLVHDKSGS